MSQQPEASLQLDKLVQQVEADEVGMAVMPNEVVTHAAGLIAALRAQVERLQADSQRCIKARNELNAAVYGKGAVIDDLETIVHVACMRLQAAGQVVPPTDDDIRKAVSGKKLVPRSDGGMAVLLARLKPGHGMPMSGYSPAPPPAPAQEAADTGADDVAAFHRIIDKLGARIIELEAALAASTGANVDAGMVAAPAMTGARMASSREGNEWRIVLVFKSYEAAEPVHNWLMESGVGPCNVRHAAAPAMVRMTTKQRADALDAAIFGCPTIAVVAAFSKGITAAEKFHGIGLTVGGIQASGRVG